MKVTNPNSRSIVAFVRGSDGASKWHEVPAGETTDVDDYVVASTLVEYGAKADRSDLEAARALWADRNRERNSKTASASASEGKILGRQQTTVDVATGTVDQLKGDDLKDAVRAANEAGAEIKVSQSAAELRSALEEWQKSAGSSTEPVVEYVVDDAGDLVLDDDGQPIPVEKSVEEDEVAKGGTVEPASTWPKRP